MGFMKGFDFQIIFPSYKCSILDKVMSVTPVKVSTKATPKIKKFLIPVISLNTKTPHKEATTPEKRMSETVHKILMNIERMILSN